MYEYTIENMIDDGVEVEEKVKYEKDKKRCKMFYVVNSKHFHYYYREDSLTDNIKKY